MIGAAGLTAAVVALGGALFGLRASLRGRRSAERLAEAILWSRVTLVAAATGNGLLVAALIGHQFGIAYVAEVGSRETPLLYTVASLWGGLAGSLLFWSLLLAGVTALLASSASARLRPLLPVALAVLFALLAFFSLLAIWPASPWGRVSPVPADGGGPNPLLTDHPLMAIHPPLLYSGFVLLAVPFALTIAALVEGRLDAVWLAAARRWTLLAWISLSLGLLAGAAWSYAVLGWGGYWAWDPVENLALLPWLTATAFLHSAMGGLRRGLAAWDVSLVVASFALTLLATLVTRSDVLNSVHAFTQSALGPLLLGLLSSVLVGSMGLLATRLPADPIRAPLGARGVAFLLNNVLLVSIAGTVLIGTLFPLFVEAASGSQVSVGAPYFDRIVGPLVLALVVLLGIGPSLPWGSWSVGSRRRLLPGLTGAALLAAGLAVGAVSPALVAGVAVAAFGLLQTVAYLWPRVWRLTRGGSRRPPSRDRPEGGSVPPRSLGGLLVHAGITVMALAVVVSATGRQETVLTLHTRETGYAGPLALTLTAVRNSQEPDRLVTSAELLLTQGGATEIAAPALSTYPTSQESIGTPAIIPGPTRNLYISLLQTDPGAGTATFRLDTDPLLSWMWVGGLLTGLGGVVAVWPGRAIRGTRVRGRAPRVGTLPADVD